MNLTKTRIQSAIDFDAQGRQVGDLRLRPSDNSRALGYHPIPVACLRNGDGPTLLVTGGTHGDEFEGPAGILQLQHELDLDRLRGRLLLFPALNAPAVAASTRCSPLDDVNLNRAFPGDINGTATAQIAHFIESVVLPECDAAIDIHSGGRASEFVPLSMFMPSAGDLGVRNHAIARAFGAPYCWIMGVGNDNRSLNSAADRAGVPMFATELGGGGRVNPDHVRLASDGIYRVMASLGMWSAAAPRANGGTQYFRITDSADTLFAPCEGLYVPAAGPGASFDADDLVGTIYRLFEPEAMPVEIRTSRGGLLISQTHHGQVGRGDFLGQFAAECEAPSEQG